MGPTDPRYRLLAFIRDRFTCQRCGATQDLTVHHCVPRREHGSSNQPWNLLTVCRDCHDDIDDNHADQDFLDHARKLALSRKPAEEPLWVRLPLIQQKRIHKLRDRFIEQELLRLVQGW